MKYKKASHAVYDCRYHLVWITKYRNGCIDEKMKKRLETVIRGICKKEYVGILKIGFEDDHVHMYISIPLNKAIPMVIQKIKGGSLKVIRKEFKTYLKEYYWDSEHLWATGYFFATVGEINGKIIAKYVEQQGKEDVEGTDIEL